VPVFVLHKLTRFAAGFPCAVFSCSFDFPATRLYLPLSFLVQQSALLFSTSSFPLRVFHFESFPALESCTRTEFPVPILFCRSVVSRSPAPLVFLFRSSVGAPPDPRGADWISQPWNGCSVRFRSQCCQAAPDLFCLLSGFHGGLFHQQPAKTELFSADFVAVLIFSARAVFQAFVGVFPVLLLSYQIKCLSFSHFSQASLVVYLSRT
jgi:hypothetical protein